MPTFYFLLLTFSFTNLYATVGRAREEYSLFHRRHFPAQDPRVDVVQPEVIAVERPPLRQLNQQRSSAGKTDQQQQQPQQHKLVDAAAQTVAPQSTTSATTTSGLVPVGDNSKDNGNNDAGESAQQVVVVDESAGNDEDDAEANDIQVAAQSPEPQPTAATETSPPVRIMILVITGGTKPSVVTNRQAVAKTWADNDTYFVTHDKVPSGSNVLWLPDAAEAPGGSILSRKVLHMWEHVADKYLDRYDFFMKADDDTYINMPLLRHNLQQVDPQLPLYMGAKHFGVIIKGTPAPNLLWQAKNYMKFAHGGAG